MSVLHPMLTAAIKAARRAGSIINGAALRLETIGVSQKRHNDFVTEVDKEAEAAIIDIISKAYPSHGILAEESGRAGREDAEYVWIIDPLDGTTNFIHGFPQYSVSIALQHRGQITQGVVYDPTRNELFTASKGRGAFLNDRRIRVTRRASLKESLVGTGFPYREMDDFDQYMRMFAAVTREVAGIRRPGSAALDLAYVACGRYDAFWELGLSPWDMAAGALMVTEAGGLVADLSGESGWLESGQIIAGTPKVFAPLLAVLDKQRKRRAPPPVTPPAD